MTTKTKTKLETIGLCRRCNWPVYKYSGWELITGGHGSELVHGPGQCGKAAAEATIKRGTPCE